MKLIGVLTSDFSVYHDLVAELKDRDVPFLSLREDQEVPANVGVVVTTAFESSVVPFKNIVIYSTPSETVDGALRALAGAVAFRRVIIGIDPGEHPGVAVIGDGRVLSTAHAQAPETVRDIADRALASLTYERATVRLGNGSPTHRDRIIHALIPLDLHLEIVDERRSTPLTYRTNAERDIAAAKAIALAQGTTYEQSAPPVIRPTSGEIRDLQRKSRITSRGRVTISRSLARAVALGRLSLEEAVRRQMRRSG